MDFKFDQGKLEEEVVRQAVNALFDKDDGDGFSRLLKQIREKVDSKIDVLFEETAEKLIQDTVDTVVRDGFNREYIKRDQWGKPQETTTISKELEKLISSYWSDKVDTNGKPTASSYGGVTRAEYLMTQICAADFSEAMKQSVTNVTGHLKDELRNKLARQMDSMLDGLFKVKSLQDQGKVEKSY